MAESDTDSPAVSTRAEDYRAVVWSVALRVAGVEALRAAGVDGDADDLYQSGMEALLRRMPEPRPGFHYEQVIGLVARRRMVDVLRKQHGSDKSHRRRSPPSSTDLAPWLDTRRAPSAEDEAISRIGYDDAMAMLTDRERAMVAASTEQGGQRRLAAEWGLHESRLSQMRRDIRHRLSVHFEREMRRDSTLP